MEKLTPQDKSFSRDYHVIQEVLASLLDQERSGHLSYSHLHLRARPTLNSRLCGTRALLELLDLCNVLYRLEPTVRFPPPFDCITGTTSAKYP